MTKLEEKARKLLDKHRMYCDYCINNGNCEKGGPFCGRCNEIGSTPGELAQAIAALAKEHTEKTLRGIFEAKRDDVDPCVWIFCRLRDADGDELIEDIRPFDRLATARKAINAFVDAALAVTEAS